MMYLADSHALFWFLTQNPKIGKNAHKAFIEAEEGKASIIIPSIVLVELLGICEKKNSAGQFTEILKKIEENPHYTILALDVEVVKQLPHMQQIPELHDRIIAASAIVTQTKLLTKDHEIIQSGYVETIW